MGSLPDIFKGIGNWFTGSGGAATPSAPTTTPQAGAASTPTAAPAASTDPFANIPIQQQGFLDNPLVQGALATYLGAIGSPRQRGFGGAIAAGGLAGLKQYESARSAQLQPYLIGAQIQKMGAEIQKDRAGARLDEGKVAQLQGIATQNHQTAEAARAQAKKFREAGQTEIADLMEANATAVDWATNKSWDPGLLLLRPYDAKRDIGEFNKNAAEADELTERAQVVDPAQATKDTAQAAQAGEEGDLAHARATQEVPAQALRDRAEAAASRSRAATSDQERQHYMAESQDLYGKLWDTMHPFESKVGGASADKIKFINDNVTSAAAATAAPEEQAAPTAPTAAPTTTRATRPTTGKKVAAPTGPSGIPALPRGAKEYAIGPNGQPGWHDMNGGFHAF